MRKSGQKVSLLPAVDYNGRLAHFSKYEHDAKVPARFFYPLPNGAMLVHPRPMCPRPKILGCCIPGTKFPWAILPLTEPSHPFDLTERSDTRLPTAARFSAAKRSYVWAERASDGGAPINKSGQGRRRSRPDVPLIH